MSGIIKATDAIVTAERLAAFHFRDVYADAETILDRARSEADRIVAGAGEQAERLRRQAEQDGLAAGREQGLTEGREKGRAEAFAAAQAAFSKEQTMLVTTLNDALNQVDLQKRSLLAAAYQDLIDLAIAIARRVVKRIGETDRQVVIENAREIIERVGRRSDMVLEVHPDDLDAMRTFAESLIAADEQRSHVRIVSDASIDPGGCRYRSGDSVVDAGLDAQVNQIARLVLPAEEEKA